jgi:hypothetical protein
MLIAVSLLAGCLVGLVAALVYRGIQSQRTHAEVTAHQLLVINRACQALVTGREPTHDEVGAWMQKRNLWCGSPGDMQRVLAEQGWVVISPVHWETIMKQLQPVRGMSVDDWLNRED